MLRVNNDAVRAFTNDGKAGVSLTFNPVKWVQDIESKYDDEIANKCIKAFIEMGYDIDNATYEDACGFLFPLHDAIVWFNVKL